MSPNSMPPPKSPYAHRRTKVNTDIQLPPSPPYSPESSTCSPKMTLSKGATFHAPLSPPAEDDPVLSIRHLPQRSPTSIHSLLDLVLDKETNAASRSLADFEQSFSRNAYHQPTNANYSLGEHISRSMSVDEDLKSQQRRLSAQFSDSGLGTSIASDSVKDFKDVQPVNVNAADLSADIEHGAGVVNNNTTPSRVKQRLTPGLFANHSRSAVTRSISPIKSQSPPKLLSNSARRRINDNIFQPLLREDRFKFLHPLVKSLGNRSKHSIKCLRDLERSLIFEPLKLSVSKTLYRSFGEFSVQLVLDTYLHLSEPEQRRAVDRPYDNGYFLDLVQQVGRLAAQVATSRRTDSSDEEGKGVDTEEMDYSPDDVVTLEGGLSQTGDLAELVRWNKEGKGISLRTNKVYEANPGIKRQADGEFDEDAERAMARRKKNADPTPLQLKCCDPRCTKIFDRKCDLAKHEKTHTRPFKCPYQTCPYNDKGLPTEKERERHINDKHTKNPKLFNCKVCEFSTKRESNCKQHMEKKHGYTYERTKGKGKKTANTPQHTPQTPNIDTPSTTAFDYSTSDASATGSVFPTPLEHPNNDFGLTPSSTPFNGHIHDFPSVKPEGFEPDGFDPVMDRFHSGPFELSDPMFASEKNNSTFSSPSTGIVSHNDGFALGGSNFTATMNAPLTNSNLRVNTQGTMTGTQPYGSSFYPDGLPTPSATSLHNLQPFSSNPSISGPSPVAPATMHTFSPNVDSAGNLHNQAITPSSNNTFLHPSFSPVGQDQLLNDFAGDSQLEQMAAVPTTSDTFDPHMEPNTVIPDFDLYGDGTAHMEFEMGQGNSDDAMALFSM